jgi:hypothetical protein
VGGARAQGDGVDAKTLTFLKHEADVVTVVADVAKAAPAASKLATIATKTVSLARVAAPVVKAVAPVAKVAGKIAGPAGIVLSGIELATAKGTQQSVSSPTPCWAYTYVYGVDPGGIRPCSDEPRCS